MLKKISLLTILLAAAAIWGFAADEGKTVTLTGHVIDTTCYMAHGGKGADHLKCAVMCAKNGIPLAILDESTDQIYLPLSTDHSNPNAKLMDFVESNVKVTGKLIEKSGMKGIAIDKIERAD
jgi:hypothetical protein